MLAVEIISNTVWDGQNVLQDNFTTGGASDRYTYSSPGSWGSGADLMSQRHGATTNFYIGDGTSSARGLVSAAQAITDTYLYKAFGEELLVTGTTNNVLRAFGMFGYQRDLASRLWVRARPLDVVKGRWSGRDPMGLRGILSNLYNYVKNRPIVIVDPSGLDDCLMLKDLPHDVAVAIFECIRKTPTDADKIKECVLDAIKDKDCEISMEYIQCEYFHSGDPCTNPEATVYETPCEACCVFQNATCTICAYPNAVKVIQCQSQYSNCMCNCAKLPFV